MEKMKKGMLYTVGFVLLGLLLLSIALLFVRNSEIAQGAKQLFDIDNVNNKYQTNSLGIKRIFDKYSFVRYNSTYDKIIISDSLPNPNMEIFSSKLSNYAAFADLVDGGKDNVCLNFDNLVIDDLEFVYFQDNSQIEGSLGHTNAVKFTILSYENITSLDWITNNGDYTITIDAYDFSGTQLNDQRDIDIEQNNKITINTEEDEIEIEIEESQFIIKAKNNVINISTEAFHSLGYAPNMFLNENCLEIIGKNVKMSSGVRLK